MITFDLGRCKCQSTSYGECRRSSTHSLPNSPTGYSMYALIYWVDLQLVGSWKWHAQQCECVCCPRAIKAIILLPPASLALCPYRLRLQNLFASRGNAQFANCQIKSTVPMKMLSQCHEVTREQRLAEVLKCCDGWECLLRSFQKVPRRATITIWSFRDLLRSHGGCQSSHGRKTMTEETHQITTAVRLVGVAKL